MEINLKMNLQENILSKLGIDNRLIKLVSRDINIPYINGAYNTVTDYWYSHPPALIPLFIGEGASYIGLLKHWFVERKLTFVKYALEWEYMLERARTADQLFTLMVLEMDMITEEITDEIIAFTKSIDFTNPKIIDDFAIEFGDNPKYLKKLIFLNQDTPLMYLENLEDYTGDYPTSEKILNAKAIVKACSYEIANKESLQNIEHIPQWLSDTNKQKLFDQYIISNELGKAWLTLNSTGWKLEDVAKALKRLIELTDDTTFHLVAEHWIKGWEQSTFKDGIY